jgi:hypothetical protein
MRSTAGFHADHLHLQGRGKSQQLRARSSFPYHHVPTGIQAQKDDFHLLTGTNVFSHIGIFSWITM